MIPPSSDHVILRLRTASRVLFLAIGTSAVGFVMAGEGADRALDPATARFLGIVGVVILAAGILTLIGVAFWFLMAYDSLAIPALPPMDTRSSPEGPS